MNIGEALREIHSNSEEEIGQSDFGNETDFESKSENSDTGSHNSKVGDVNKEHSDHITDRGDQAITSKRRRGKVTGYMYM